MKIAAREFFGNRRCRKQLIFCLTAVIIFFCCWHVGVFDFEPSYKGELASEILEAASEHDGVSTVETIAAFKAMGPKGTIFLARALDETPFLLPTNIDNFIQKLALPDLIDPRERIERNAYHIRSRREAAASTLIQLGTNAEPALPILVSEYKNRHANIVAQALAPMANKLATMVPFLIQDLNQNKNDNDRLYFDINDDPRYLDIRLLQAIGPKGKDALPVLRQMSNSTNFRIAPAAAVAIWNIAQETNELIRLLSTKLNKPDDYGVLSLLECRSAAPPPKPLVPLLVQALKHPNTWTRREAELLLAKIDPMRLRQIEDDLDHRQDELLREHLNLLQSTNVRDRLNAERALPFFGPKAAGAVSRLAEILAESIQPHPVNIENRNIILSILGSIGPAAGAETPTLVRLLQTDSDSARDVCHALGTIGPNAAEALPILLAMLATNDDTQVDWNHPDKHVPQWELARSISLIDPHQSNTIPILRQAALTPSSPMRPRRFPLVDQTYDIGAVATLWQLGLSINCPVDALVAEERFETLGELGPAAAKAVPMLEKVLKENPDHADAALALWKIDPEEAKCLGLPGLFIICPDKY
jgi:hypothetical protein